MVKQLENSQKISQQKQIREIPLDFAVEAIKRINNSRLNDESLYDLTCDNILKLGELIDAPFLFFEGVEKYPTLEEKAAVIFCATIRGHKFGNGNKRTAVILLLALLYVNAKWISLSWDKLYKLAIAIAEDTCTDFDTQVETITAELVKVVISLEEFK